jgi:hypothetical protein
LNSLGAVKSPREVPHMRENTRLRGALADTAFAISSPAKGGPSALRFHLEFQYPRGQICGADVPISSVFTGWPEASRFDRNGRHSGRTLPSGHANRMYLLDPEAPTSAILCNFRNWFGRFIVVSLSDVAVPPPASCQCVRLSRAVRQVYQRPY